MLQTQKSGPLAKEIWFFRVLKGPFFLGHAKVGEPCISGSNQPIFMQFFCLF